MNTTTNIVDRLIHSRRHLKDNETVYENMETRRIDGTVRRLTQDYDANSKPIKEHKAFYYIGQGMYKRSILLGSD